jgi:hypothetical protein
LYYSLDTGVARNLVSDKIASPALSFTFTCSFSSVLLVLEGNYLALSIIGHVPLAMPMPLDSIVLHVSCESISASSGVQNQFRLWKLGISSFTHIANSSGNVKLHVEQDGR